MSTGPTRPRAYVLAERLGDIESLDALADRVYTVVKAAVPPGSTLKDALAGSWLGHALHPLLTDVAIGSWSSAALLDVLGGEDSDRSAELLVAAGLLAALPTAASGWSDWADSAKGDERVGRIGLVHAASNITALSLYGASLAARRTGRRGYGRLLGFGGLAGLALGGLLGGHLSYSRGVGVDETTFERRATEWTEALAESELSDGRPHAADVDGEGVMLVLREGQIFALADRCAHRGGALHEGELVDDCIECPLHASRFRLADGSLAKGPSAYPQPAYDVRVRDARVEVRARS